MSDNQPDWKWWVGHDDEIYHTECETREEAIRIASEEQDGGYICEARKSPIKLSPYFLAGTFLELADEQALEEHGNPDGPDSIFDTTKAQQADLENRIRAAIDQWQQDNALSFTGWQFTETRNQELIPAAE